MPAAPTQIVALGGGGFSMEPRNPLLDDFVLDLARRERPRVCFVPTASGDAAEYVTRFYTAFPPERARATHLPLFTRDARDPRAHLLAQDVIYVGGGSTANLLAVWRAHGIDAVVREAWERGVVLAGVSAGALCWFDGGITDSFGALAPITGGLGLVAGSYCPHYDGEPGRRAAFHAAIGDGLAAGWGVDDGAALHVVGGEVVAVVASRPGARAYRVRGGPGGAVREDPLDARDLGSATAGPD